MEDVRLEHAGKDGVRAAGVPVGVLGSAGDATCVRALPWK
jgi:hypothetical protein